MRKEQVQVLIDAAIAMVDEAVAAHERGEPADLSVSMLRKVRTELERMAMAMSRQVFRPGFGRFLLEWPDEHGLVKRLMAVEYHYERMK